MDRVGLSRKDGDGFHHLLPLPSGEGRGEGLSVATPKEEPQELPLPPGEGQGEGTGLRDNIYTASARSRPREESVIVTGRVAMPRQAGQWKTSTRIPRNSTPAALGPSPSERSKCSGCRSIGTLHR